METKKIILVNNSGFDLQLIRAALIEYAKTGIDNPELSEFFRLQRIETDLEIRIIIHF